MLWRIIIAVVVVVVLLAILPPFFRVVGFPVTGDIWLILRIAIAGIAVLYVLGYPKGTWPGTGPP